MCNAVISRGSTKTMIYTVEVMYFTSKLEIITKINEEKFGS